jgi:hypothetical protein
MLEKASPLSSVGLVPGDIVNDNLESVLTRPIQLMLDGAMPWAALRVYDKL